MIHIYLVLTLNKETELKRWNAKELLRRQHWWQNVICRLDKALRILRLLEKRWKTAESTELISWLVDCSLGDTATPHRSIQGWLAKPILGWVIKTQTPLCSDISIPHQRPISFFTHLSKKTQKTKKQGKTLQNCYRWGPKRKHERKQYTPNSWNKLDGGMDTGPDYHCLLQTLFLQETLRRTDRWENAWESTGKEEMETKWKPLPHKKGTWETKHLILNIPRMALKGTTDNKTKSQYS